MRKSWSSFFRRSPACVLFAAPPPGRRPCAMRRSPPTVRPMPVYDDGWQAGDNGGFGFGPWDFTGTYNTPVGQTMDIFSSPQ